jgi:hypothetical protein
MLVESLPWRRRAGTSAEAGGNLGGAIGGGSGAAGGFRMAVDGDIGDVGQQLGRAVLALHLLEQFRRFVDEARRVAGVAEFRVAR